MARLNLYVPDALLRKAKTELPPELSISGLLRVVLEDELAKVEAAEAATPATPAASA